MQAAAAVQDGTHAEIRHSFDIWQLGMLIYEVHSGAPYWSRHPSDASILQCLAGPRGAVASRAGSRGARSPFRRWCARRLCATPRSALLRPALEALLRAELTKEMPNRTLNPGDILDEGQRELVI